MLSTWCKPVVSSLTVPWLDALLCAYQDRVWEWHEHSQGRRARQESDFTEGVLRMRQQPVQPPPDLGASHMDDAEPDSDSEDELDEVELRAAAEGKVRGPWHDRDLQGSGEARHQSRYSWPRSGGGCNCQYWPAMQAGAAAECSAVCCLGLTNSCVLVVIHCCRVDS